MKINQKKFEHELVWSKAYPASTSKLRDFNIVWTSVCRCDVMCISVSNGWCLIPLMYNYQYLCLCYNALLEINSIPSQPIATSMVVFLFVALFNFLFHVLVCLFVCLYVWLFDAFIGLYFVCLLHEFCALHAFNCIDTILMI